MNNRWLRDTRAESVLAQMTETGVYEIVPDTDEYLAGLMVDCERSRAPPWRAHLVQEIQQAEPAAGLV